MLRVAQPRQALCLQRAIASRSYSAPAEGQAQASERPQRRRPHNRAPVSFEGTSDYQAPLKLPAEGSLASQLLRETESGKSAAEKIHGLASGLAAKRRAARLEREAEQKALGDAPVQLPRPDRAPRTLTPKFDFEQLAGSVQQPRGDRRGPRGDFPAGDRAQGDRRRPRDGNRTSNGRARKPAPRVLTQNRPPTSIQAAEESLSAAEEAELVVELDLPNQPGPAPVSQNLGEIFPKLDLQSTLPMANDEKSSQVEARALRRLAGDYSAYVPAPSKDLYTTPPNQLPVRTQLALAVAHNKGMDINQRKFFTDVVRKAVGEVGT